MTIEQDLDRPFNVNAMLALGATFLPERMNTWRSRVLLHAIALQESNLEHRFQVVAGSPRVKGPARGFWQFERGGVTGVMNHPSSRYWLHDVCSRKHIAFQATAIWTALENDDELAFVVARLLLFTDPLPLPAPTEIEACWQYYLRNWRPGKPHVERWRPNLSHAYVATA